jgi:hypothetical protein
MPKGVKRQTEEASSPMEDSPEKKIRINENLLKFEKMKKEAEENRRRVRDEYLKEHASSFTIANNTSEQSEPSRRETIAAVPSSRTPVAKTKAPKKTKSPAATKPKTPSAAPKPARKTPAKSPAAKKADASTKKPTKTPTKAASKTPTKKSEGTKKPTPKKSTPVSVVAAPLVLPHVSSEDDEKIAAAEVLDNNNDDWCGQLYPTVALSDAFNAIGKTHVIDTPRMWGTNSLSSNVAYCLCFCVGHLCAAFIAVKNGQEIAGLGFLSVWLAAIVGVLRFGVSEKLFEQANSDLANLAGFVGYPLIGMSFVAKHFKALDINVVFIGFMLVAWETLTRSFLERNKEAAKLVTNILFFVGPIIAVCQATEDYYTLGALIAFVLAGIVITPHHENRIFGVRCVDWFHYIIGSTACMFAQGLGTRV